jgi:Pretoxin HINT domain
VLSQDPKTGVLSFQPVLTVYHNPPAPTLTIDLGGETVVATAIHRFWRAGKGWAMARDLKPGDLIRTLGGTARVVAVTENAVQPVFNLEVAGGHSFFVGDRGALVHDNSLVQPLHQVFDAAPEIAATPSTPAPVRRPGRPA